MARRFAHYVAFLWLTVLASTLGQAAQIAVDSYPDRPVSYIIPFGAGGESGIAARLQQSDFQKITGQDLVVTYRPGGGGAVVWDALNSMPADGYTIVGINLPHIILQPALGAGYRTDDITGVFIFHYTPDAVVVRDDSPFETLDDLLTYARDHPGQLTFSGSGRGTANHLAQIRFDKQANIETRYTDYKGTAASITALLDERVDASWGYTTVGKAYKGDVRLLAIATKERHSEFPKVPTFRELEFDIVDGAYRGIAVPKKTPKQLRERLSDIFAQINRKAEMRTEMEQRGFVPVDIPYPDIPAFMKARQAEYLTLAKRAGLIN